MTETLSSKPSEHSSMPPVETLAATENASEKPGEPATARPAVDSEKTEDTEDARHTDDAKLPTRATPHPHYQDQKRFEKVAYSILFDRQHKSGCYTQVAIMNIVNGRFDGNLASFVLLRVACLPAKQVTHSDVKFKFDYAAGPPRPVVIERYRPRRIGCRALMDIHGNIVRPSFGTVHGFPSYDTIFSSDIKQPGRKPGWGFRKTGEIIASRRTTLTIANSDYSKHEAGIIGETPVGLIIRHDGRPYTISAKQHICRRFRHCFGFARRKRPDIKQTVTLDAKTDWLMNTDVGRWLKENVTPDTDFKDWDASIWRKLVPYPDFCADGGDSYAWGPT